MALDIALRDNGTGSFDISLAAAADAGIPSIAKAPLMALVIARGLQLSGIMQPSAAGISDLVMPPYRPT